MFVGEGLNLQNCSGSSWQIWHQHTNNFFTSLLILVLNLEAMISLVQCCDKPTTDFQYIILRPAILFASYNINLFNAEDKLINTIAGMK